MGLCVCVHGNDQLVEKINEADVKSCYDSDRGTTPSEPGINVNLASDVSYFDSERGAAASCFGFGSDFGTAVSITIGGTRRLRQADWFPMVNPSEIFCTARHCSGDEDLHRTKVLKDVVEPVWDEEFGVAEFGIDDAIEFNIWDLFEGSSKMPDGSKHILVGTAYLECIMFAHSGFNGEIEIERSGESTGGYLQVKAAITGLPYPEGPAPEVKIRLAKVGAEHLGVDFDIEDKNLAYVTDIRQGPMMKHNRCSKPSQQLNVGDFVFGVNGLQGDSERLVDIMNEESHLGIMVRRPAEICVAVFKKERRAPAGLEFASKPAGGSLLVLKVTPGGPVELWNLQHPKLAVRVGDRVVAVNGERARAPDLVRQMRSLERFLLTVVRPMEREVAVASRERSGSTAGRSNFAQV